MNYKDTFLKLKNILLKKHNLNFNLQMIYPAAIILIALIFSLFFLFESKNPLIGSWLGKGIESGYNQYTERINISKKEIEIIRSGFKPGKLLIKLTDFDSKNLTAIGIVKKSEGNMTLPLSPKIFIKFILPEPEAMYFSFNFKQIPSIANQGAYIKDNKDI